MPNNGWTSNPTSNLCKSHGGGNNERELFQRSVISKLNRLELEDKFFRAIESNVLLKKRINFQEEKLKLLGTKLLRLNEQLKRESSHNLFHPFESLNKEQEIKIAELEKTNVDLLNKIGVLMRQSPIQQYSTGLGKGKKYNRKLAENKKSEQHESSSDSNKLASDVAETEKFVAEHGEERHSSNTSSPDSQQAESNVVSYINTTSIARDQEEIEANSPAKVDCEDVSANVNQVVEVSSAIVQTDLTKTYYDDINEKLHAKEATILELQTQIKSLKVKQNVMNEVENLFEIISQKSNKDVSKRKKKSTRKDMEVSKLKQELEMEKINLETIKTINGQLVQDLCTMQARIDSLSIKSKHCNYCDESSGEQLKTEQIDKPNDSVKISSTKVETKLIIEKVSEKEVKNVTNDVLIPSSTVNIEITETEEPVATADEVSRAIDQEGFHNADLTPKVSGVISPKKIEPLMLSGNISDTELDGDDATYDIVSDKSHKSSSHHNSSGTLSDGEVPRDLSVRSDRSDSQDTTRSSVSSLETQKEDVDPTEIDKNENQQLEVGEIAAFEVRAEMTLRAISENLENCKKLISTYPV